MLEELHVQNLALIEDVWLEFAPGMTAITGETGAGKTALVGALKLLLGERADSSAVRDGAKEAFVEGRFRLDGEDVVARRRVTADGRSRCQLGGQIATVTELGDALGPMVDLHGQHEHQALLSASTHGTYLDRWTGSEATGALEAYRSAREDFLRVRTERDELRARLAEAEKQAGYLRYVAQEIDAAEPVAGEDDAIATRLPALKHAEKLAEAASDAVESLRGDESASAQLARARAALAGVGGIDPVLDALDARLAEAEAALEDAGSDLRRYRDGVEHDPRALDDAMSRMAVLDGLKKKYGPTLDDVLARRDEATSALEEFEFGDEGLRQAESTLAEAEAVLREAAGALSDVRRRSAPEFAAALTTAASDLALSGASFEVALTPLGFEQWRETGADKVEFLFSPAPASTPRPLAKIASGGEVSRVMLALKSVLGAADDVPVLVFDEIDAGVGGAAAQAVGARLSELGRTHQVIVVTHLPQVAARASRQLVVAKTIEHGGVQTTVTPVEAEARVSEIARMLSGVGSEASLAHARELIEGASAGG